ncbi:MULTISPECIES: NACHT domain-containing protein [Elizabethkingia]|jgi:hypothetical protein|uniref:Predicted NTPase (NACHT family) n=1 Tax=Elizabethkingia anophelis TaxID=1117645 RepID=A0A7Z7LYT2_9FLAO|nr:MULTISPECIES: hypothetical protein [Elizabethkingia]MDV3704706.1 hypothetical protein [Elizabethkingia anophelis]ODM53844.1 hypothetical protein BES09_06470 [Elizabethkingia meningoseptica]OHT29072.1 hypothetical protein BFF93_06480 [Elizabethkingia meningoseptica]STD12054.1 Predicted NTPase (NACHT family) [Elizabethkingia anophelis]
MYYEQRYIKTPKSSLEIQLIDEQSKNTLSDILDQNNRIVLLGNPGIGKSTELNILFDLLEVKKEDVLNFPFRIDLKNFRAVSKFEDLIHFKKWEDLPCITFILDGLDEIAVIQDFISELESFLSKNEDKNINVVISCRTNIYEKYLINISGFKYFYLDGLTDRQINNILEKRISKLLNNGELNKFRVYLENPFNLNLFCEYYESKKSYPDTQTESWDLFIENELKKLTKAKLKKREEISIPHIKDCLKKVAFTSELMQQNFISEDHVYELLGKDDKSTFEQISFIEKLPNSGNYTFRHKNYQEFFSAKLLAEFSTEQIISLIRLTPEENITKPSLFNTITFLLNIVDDDKLADIEKWLLENEPEVLFLTEKGRLGESTQHQIFRRYFNEISVEKTFWFGKDRRFSIDKIAEFADVDFLIEIIKKNNHFRSVISALDVLSFTDSNTRDSEIKDIFKGLIFSEGRYQDVALRSFRSKGFHKNDQELFKEITKKFCNNFSPEINHQILAMIADFQNVDEYFDILINSLYKLYEIRPERIKDNTMRGTRWLLEKIFLKIKNAENFLAVLNVIFNSKFDLKLTDFYSNDFREKLIARIIFFVNKENDFLFRVIDAFLRPEDSFIYRRDNILVEIINCTPKDINAFRYIVNTYGLSDKNYLLLSLFNNTMCIDYLAAKYQNNELKIQKLTDINYLRYRYFNNLVELGYYFEKVFKEAGYEFPEDLPNEKQIVEEKKKRQIFIQNNFEILFNKEAMACKVAEVFDTNNIEDMTWKLIHDIEWDWYKTENFHGVHHSVFKAIGASVRSTESKTKEDVIKHIGNDYFLLFQIKDKIKDRENEGFEVKEEHISYIKTYALKFAEKFKFDKVINIKSDGNLGLYNGYYVLKLLYFFDKKYDFHYSQDFYLKTLRYCNIFGSAEGTIQFVKERVGNLKLFNEQIVYNLNNVVLDSSSLKDHIEYAIENKLKEAYGAIEENFLNDRFIYSQKDFLSKYIELIPKGEQIIFLEKCCTEIDSYLCWKAVEVMIEKKLNEKFILDIANQYIAEKKDTFIFGSDALTVLFYCSAEGTLLTYSGLLRAFSQTVREDYRDDYNIKDISNYKRLDELPMLVEIFEIAYDENLKKDTFDFHHSQNVLKALVSSLSDTEKGYKEIQTLLYNLKSKISDNDSKLFYVNMLIDDSQSSYYVSISKPFTFKEAKNYLEYIENDNKQKTIIMGNYFDFKGANLKNTQIGGKGNTLNVSSNNEDLNKVKEILKEFEQLKIDNKEWKNIITEGLADLTALSEEQSEPELEKSKSTLRKIHDYILDIGKRTNDWKNIAVLPVEFHDKVPKLIELGNSLLRVLHLK